MIDQNDTAENKTEKRNPDYIVNIVVEYKDNKTKFFPVGALWKAREKDNLTGQLYLPDGQEFRVVILPNENA